MALLFLPSCGSSWFTGSPGKGRLYGAVNAFSGEFSGVPRAQFGIGVCTDSAGKPISVPSEAYRLLQAPYQYLLVIVGGTTVITNSWYDDTALHFYFSRENVVSNYRSGYDGSRGTISWNEKPAVAFEWILPQDTRIPPRRRVWVKDANRTARLWGGSEVSLGLRPPNESPVNTCTLLYEPCRADGECPDPNTAASGAPSAGAPSRP